MSDASTPRAPYTVEGPRIGLRPFRYEDADEFTARVRESEDLHRPWLFPPGTPAAYTAYARSLIEDPARRGHLVCERDGGGIAGFVNVNNIVRGSFECGALGYGVFAHAAGRGLMGEALALVVRHAFGPLGLHRLEANVQPGNGRSLALLRRAGFRREGYSPAMLRVDGAWRDHERWAITAEMPLPPLGPRDGRGRCRAGGAER
ncbi:GNAT family N-acetyltransferase [Streptomyces somaliensis]|uniref:GNAT family N-acetyltransferase n=1 Tax=Streptomyces somaliensis TaxID=78355 RepID=UPI0020CEDCEE|nr:GNAT family protein [Streptomyces somaliensis]MCP9943650.1 GNAT family N-acetyltransferase [Streptomyces somaliensis]MCP9963102.1 GNAT family N-acetyltransferase [Streptomyces somaliensis]MCP9975953.1 GNAT family N-acetyltransferase [Streptomyces somaliensis]